jgi:hypothetical protein
MPQTTRSGHIAPTISDLAESTIIDFSSLASRAEHMKTTYQQASPFPHIMFEGLVEHHWLKSILERVPEPSDDVNWRQITDNYDDGDFSQVGKLGLPHANDLSPLIRELLWEMNSAEFLSFLEELTGIKGLIPDPRLQGGGIHQILPGGHLGVHVDFTEHRYYKLSRRINVLLYLNEDWDDEYGGHLELWNNELDRCERRIRPLIGRCVIFNTDKRSWHGHPETLKCPEGTTRKSIALYYYTCGRDDDTEPTTKTIWRKTSRQSLPDFE